MKAGNDNMRIYNALYQVCIDESLPIDRLFFHNAWHSVHYERPVLIVQGIQSADEERRLHPRKLRKEVNFVGYFCRGVPQQ